MKVRPRSEADVEACVRIAEQVHQLDAYPDHPPNGDLAAFLVSDVALAVWVMEDAGEVIGHVALHARSSLPVLELASAALGMPFERLGVVARLFVAPSARRKGVARQLLQVVVDEARSRSLFPVLDVRTTSSGAIALYEACGWRSVGKVSVTLRDKSMFEETVFLGPETTS